MKKVKQTHHSLYRMNQRLGVSSAKTASAMILAAKKHGASPEDFPEGELKNFLIEKSWSKKVKVYHRHMYIFNKNSRRAITVYLVPKRFETELDATDLDKAK